MNKFRYIFSAFVFLAFTSSLKAQKSALDGKQATLHNYSFAITDEYQMFLDLMTDEDRDLIIGEEDPVERLFTDKSYERIKAAIEDKTGLGILPKETLEGKVVYDIYGYPAGGSKKAAKRGNTPYYLKLNVQMTARDIIDEELGVNDVDFQKRRIKPFVFIKATFFDERGKKLFQSEGKAKGDRWIKLDQTALFGLIALEGQNIVDEQETLLSVLDEAIADLLTKLP